MALATAPGKVILFGEHAVVYGRPAIAAPVSQLRATASAIASAEAGVRLMAPDLGIDMTLAQAAEDDPLAAALRQVMWATGVTQLPPMTLVVTSQIPVASGLGSGAAIAAAVIRAVTEFLGYGKLATHEWVSALTYEVEKIHHGTPSGIDNTVVVYEQPVYFVRQQPQNRIETFQVTTPLRLLIADTGTRSSTKTVVADVRRQWQSDSPRFDKIFDECGRLSEAARSAIERGDLVETGRLMNENQRLLQEMTVSSAQLNRLAAAALQAGALGAKLSGAGKGGNVIALVTEELESAVQLALLAHGASQVIASVIA